MCRFLYRFPIQKPTHPMLFSIHLKGRRPRTLFKCIEKSIKKSKSRLSVDSMQLLRKMHPDALNICIYPFLLVFLPMVYSEAKTIVKNTKRKG